MSVERRIEVKLKLNYREWDRGLAISVEFGEPDQYRRFMEAAAEIGSWAMRRALEEAMAPRPPPPPTAAAPARVLPVRPVPRILKRTVERATDDQLRALYRSALDHLHSVEDDVELIKGEAKRRGIELEEAREG